MPICISILNEILILYSIYQYVLCKNVKADQQMLTVIVTSVLKCMSPTVSFYSTNSCTKLQLIIFFYFKRIGFTGFRDFLIQQSWNFVRVREKYIEEQHDQFLSNCYDEVPMYCGNYVL